MTTTCIRDSIVGDAWIQQTAAAVPVQRVIDQKTGQPTGDILTGPVRLAFDTLFELPKPSAKVENPKFGASLLFTPFADFTIMYEEYYAVCAREFQADYVAATGQYYGLHSPFRDQAEKMKFGGFTPGCIFMTSTSKFKPPVIDVRGNPIVDPSKVYPGVWAICSVSAYAFKDPRKRGVGFGLQSVMIIGDDTKFGTGGADPNVTFGGVKGAIIAPAISPGVLAHMPQGGQMGMPPGPPQGHAVPPPQGGTYAQPPQQGYAPQPPRPPVGGAGGYQQPPQGGGGGGYQQPGVGATYGAPQGGYQMPGQPAGDPRGQPPQGFSTWAEYDDLMGG